MIAVELERVNSVIVKWPTPKICIQDLVQTFMVHYNLDMLLFFLAEQRLLIISNIQSRLIYWLNYYFNIVSCYRFKVDFRNKKFGLYEDNIPFHLAIWFNNNETYIIRNTRTGSSWGHEEKEENCLSSTRNPIVQGKKILTVSWHCVLQL